MLNLYQLQMFVTVADKGSFSAAAKELLVTQPAVSEQIRSLEQRLGVQLFDRRGHRLELTPEGAAMLEPARRLLALAAETEEGLAAQRGAISGRLRLGCSTSAAGTLLASLAGRFCGEHPQVSLKLEPLDQQLLLDMLRDGQLDAGFVGEGVRARGLDQHRVAADDWVLLVPEGHEWNNAGERKENGPPDGEPASISPAQLRQQRLVVEGAGSILSAQARRELQVLLDERGVAWRDLTVALELPGAQEVLEAVLAGAGVGILPRALVAPRDGARIFSLEGPQLTRSLYIVRAARHAVSRVAATWWEFVVSRAVQAVQPDLAQEPGE